jgi:YesN/AraC family two-component response regulator
VNHSSMDEKTYTGTAHYSHPSFIFERKLLRAIQSGSEPEAIAAVAAKRQLEPENPSEDALDDFRHALIASLSLYADAAVVLGLSSEEARRLTETFQKRIQSLATRKALSALEYEMALKFINFVKCARTKKYKFPVSKIVAYIYENATERITLYDLAAMVHLSPDYLSRLFLEELGVHITDFILANKVESAKNLLEFSRMTVTEIAAFLQFCNAAYFTSVFKKYTDQTPYQYRKAYCHS